MRVELHRDLHRANSMTETGCCGQLLGDMGLPQVWNLNIEYYIHFFFFLEAKKIKNFNYTGAFASFHWKKKKHLLAKERCTILFGSTSIILCFWYFNMKSNGTVAKNPILKIIRSVLRPLAEIGTKHSLRSVRWMLSVSSPLLECYVFQKTISSLLER